MNKFRLHEIEAHKASNYGVIKMKINVYIGKLN